MGRFKELFSASDPKDELAFLADYPPCELKTQEIDLLQQSVALGRLIELRDRIEAKIDRMKYYQDDPPNLDELKIWNEITGQIEDILK